MKLVYTALIFGAIIFPAFAETPTKPAPRFADAPPPPLVAPAAEAGCCTDAGRFTLLKSAQKDTPPIEGAACEIKTADGSIRSGTICY